MQPSPTLRVQSERWLGFCLRNTGPAPDTNLLVDFLRSHFGLTGEPEEGSLCSAPRSRGAARLQGGAGGSRGTPAPAPTPPLCCCIFMSCLTYIQTGSH